MVVVLIVTANSLVEKQLPKRHLPGLPAVADVVEQSGVHASSHRAYHVGVGVQFAHTGFHPGKGL